MDLLNRPAYLKRDEPDNKPILRWAWHFYNSLVP